MSRESFLRKGSKVGNTASHKRAKKQEKEIAKRAKGQRVPGSGVGKIKGDVRVKNFTRIECKTTSHRSFSVTMEMLDKIEEAALSTNEIPIIVVEFNDGKGKKLREVAVVPTYMLDCLS